MLKLQPTQWVAVAALPVAWGIISLLLFPVTQPFLAGILLLALAGAGILAYVLARRVAGAPMPTGAVTVLVLVGVVIPLFFFLWSHIAAHRWFSSAPGGNNQGKKENGTSPPQQPVSLAPALAEMRAELQKAGTFFELPLNWREPIPPHVPGTDKPPRYIHIPPGKTLQVEWEGASWQATEDNFIYCSATGGEKWMEVTYHSIFEVSPYGSVIALKGKYTRPQHLDQTSPKMDIGVLPDRDSTVISTTIGKQNAAGKWELVAVPPGFWLWGKLPPRSINWQCVVRLADTKGKPVAKKHPPLLVVPAVKDGKVVAGTKTKVLPWESYNPPSDPEDPLSEKDRSAAVFKNTDIPAAHDYLVIQTKKPRRIYVALVLSK